MTPAISLRAALDDPQLLGNALAGPSWATWRAMLLAAMGEPLTPDELAVFQRFTGRTAPPPCRVDEMLAVAGRRAGKDRSTSVLSSYLAAFVDYQHVLAPGEVGTVVVIGPDQRQSAIQLNYIEGVFASSPVLSGMIVNRTADTLELSNGILIEVRAASFRRLRGPTAVAVIATEAAFWHSDESSSNTDTDILNAARPMLATTGGPLIVITSPYAKKGEVYETHRRHFGPDGDPLILVAQGASRDFNPTLSERVVQRALERDEASARAEYLGQFRDDLADFVSREAVQVCVDAGVRSRTPQPGASYFAFHDPSGGAADSTCLGIAHREGTAIIVDCVREIPAPHDPESAVGEFASLLKQYRIRDVTGDRYAARWNSQAWERRGITYRHSELSKSELYLNLLPLLNSKGIRLLDQARAVNQICALERRTSRGGRDSIDHPPGAHDDLANAIAGAAHIASGRVCAVGVHTYSFGYSSPTRRRSVLYRDGERRLRIRSNPEPERTNTRAMAF